MKDSQIENMRIKASLDGDHALSRLCVEALKGDRVARRKCQDRWDRLREDARVGKGDHHKDPAAVSLGRKGGRVRSDAKTTAVRANAAKPRPRGKYYTKGYADGWRDAMTTAEAMVRAWADVNLHASDANEAHRLAFSIAAEPAPKKDGK